MNIRTLAACVALLVLTAPACNPPARHAALSLLFDGVPPPPPVAAPAAQPLDGPESGKTPSKTHYTEHGPYAARACTACHKSASSNSFVVPREKLCFQCHDFKLDKKYIHGPLASGGCLACHDPHSSQHKYLLVAESDNFCFRCHERSAVERNPVHEGVDGQCTECHNPHMSDNEYLLR